MNYNFSDLFNVEYVHGGIDSGPAGWFAEHFGQIAFTVISIVGFGMTMMAFMKVAIAALYFVVPSFWDKVEEAHKLKKRGKESGKQGALEAAAGIGMMILGWFPNVKASLSDKDKNVSPATFFTKAIPAMCIQVTIGVLIFYGYTADIGQYVAKIATKTIDVVLANTDPTALLTLLPDNFVLYNFATDSSNTYTDKLINSISREAVKQYISNKSSIVEEDRQELAYQIEAWVQTKVTSDPNKTDYLDEELFDCTWTVQVMRGVSVGDREFVDNQANNVGGKTFTFKEEFTYFPAGNGALESSENLWLVVTMDFSKNAVTVVQAGVRDLTLVVNEETIARWDLEDDGNTLRIKLSEVAGWSFASKTGGTVIAILGDGTNVEGFLSNNILTFTTTNGKLKDVTEMTIQSLVYRGVKDYKVTKIVKDTVDGFSYNGEIKEIGSDPATWNNTTSDVNNEAEEVEE